MPKKKKVDRGELTEPEAVVTEEPVTEEPKKRAHKLKEPLVVISDEQFIDALTAVGGTAKLGQLYKEMTKECAPSVPVPVYKTFVRKKGIVLATAGKIEALHVDGKRTYTFKLVQ